MGYFTTLYGFSRANCDHSLFTLQMHIGFMVVIVYVDDILVTGNSSALILHIKSFLHSQFKI